jgi:hypothetical protein
MHAFRAQIGGLLTTLRHRIRVFPLKSRVRPSKPAATTVKREL